MYFLGPTPNFFHNSSNNKTKTRTRRRHAINNLLLLQSITKCYATEKICILDAGLSFGIDTFGVVAQVSVPRQHAFLECLDAFARCTHVLLLEELNKKSGPGSKNTSGLRLVYPKIKN